jgi:hypothetical protein
MNDPEKRICPFCVETINAKAKLCPHCRQWLTWKSFRHPVVAMLVHVVPLVVIWVVLAMVIPARIAHLFNPKPHYSAFPNSLKILESRMNWVQTPKGLRIYITGVLTNTSPVSWGDVEFDCRFFDSHQAMQDADTGRSYVTVAPDDDMAFRVAIIPTAPTNDYASFKIAVGNARNANGMFY